LGDARCSLIAALAIRFRSVVPHGKVNGSFNVREVIFRLDGRRQGSTVRTE
jgi:hypothetical protein